MNRVGLRCVPYPMIGGKRFATIITDGGHFLNVIYDNNEIDQVCASLTKLLPTQFEFNFAKSNAGLTLSGECSEPE